MRNNSYQYLEILKREKYKILLVIEAVLLIIIHTASIRYFYGFTMSEDELGYWGIAAKFAGLNWGNVLENTSYYSWGYSIVLSILMRVIHNPIVLYRTGLFLNSIYLLVAFGVSTALFNKIFKDVSRELISIVCLIVNFSAGYYVNSKIAWVECFLVMLTWLILFQAYLIYEKKTFLRQFIFVIEIIYIYFVHMRTVPYLILGIMYLLITNIVGTIENRQNKIKKIASCIVFIMLTLVIVTAGGELKRYLQDSLFKNTVLTNDYSAIVSSVKGDSLDNTIKSIIYESLGVFFYFYSISFGMILWGLIEVGIKIRELLNSKDYSLIAFYLYGVLIFIGECAVTSVFMRNSGFASRIDMLIYGRYAEQSMGFLFVIGILSVLCEFNNKKKIYIGQCIFFVIMSAVFIHVMQVSWIKDIQYYQSACAAGLYYIWQRFGMNVIYITCFVLFISVTFIFITRTSSKMQPVLYSILAVCFLSFCMLNGRASVSQYAAYQNKVRVLYDNKNLLERIKEDGEIAFLSDSPFSMRGNVQLYLVNKPIICKRPSLNKDEYKYYKFIIYEITADQSEFENNILGEGFVVYADLGSYKIYEKID